MQGFANTNLVEGLKLNGRYVPPNFSLFLLVFLTNREY
jgi:hypothetical protein